MLFLPRQGIHSDENSKVNCCLWNSFLWHGNMDFLEKSLYSVFIECVSDLCFVSYELPRLIWNNRFFMRYFVQSSFVFVEAVPLYKHNF